MGLKHLIQIRNYLKEQTEPVTIATIRKALIMSYPTIKACLAELEDSGKIQLFVKSMAYKWKKQPLK